MHVVNAATVEDYLARLKADPDEVTLLFRDLLIQRHELLSRQGHVRDSRRQGDPALFEGKTADGTVRLWVPGCATGEEAYSLAMLLREHLDSVSAAPKVQLFATDIDESAIATARLGRYPKTLLEGSIR